VGALRAGTGDNQAAVAIPINTQIATRRAATGDGMGLGVGEGGSPAFTLQAARCHAAAVEHHPRDGRAKIGCGGMAQTLTSRLGTGGNNVPLALKIRMGAEGGEEAATHGQTLFEPKAYSVNLKERPSGRIYEAEASRTLDTGGSQQQTYILQGSMIGREYKNGPRGSGVNEGAPFSPAEADSHAAAYSLTVGGFGAASKEKAATLMGRDYKDMQAVTTPQYAVRRLTPTECARLQGFCDAWCANLETPAPTDEEISFWAQAFETHRLAMGTSSKPKSRNQIIKWLRSPYSESAEYKMWGNGVALPCAVFVLAGIVRDAEW
jgi:DNA (cytosine-5)-methyltransferase 1